MITLTTQTNVIASGNSGSISPTRAELIRTAEFLLNVTAAATAAGDTLDVYIQSSIDGGTTWDDFVHFTQVLGNGGAKKYIAQWERDLSPTTPQHAPQDAAIAAGVQQGPIGPTWRVKWVIVSSSSPQFTFTVSAQVTLTSK
jgi:hypothetical protein